MKKNIAHQLIAVTLAAVSLGCGSSSEIVTQSEASQPPSGVSVRGWGEGSIPTAPIVDPLGDELTLLSRDAEARIGDFTTGTISIYVPKITKDGTRAFFFANSRELSDETETFAFSTPPESLYLYTTKLGSGKYEIITARPAPGQSRYFGPQPVYTGQFSISEDGRYLAFESSVPLDPTYPDIHYGIYRMDRESGECRLATIKTDGTPYDYETGSDVSLSADGQCLTFKVFSQAGSYYDLFVRDMNQNTSELIATNVKPSETGRTLSADGRIVIFSKSAPNGEEGSRVYRHDRQTDQTQTISTNDWGEPEGYCLTDNGRFVIYRSRAVGLSPEILQRHELMVYDHQTGQTEQVNFDSEGELIRLRQNWYIENENPLLYDISEDGRYVTFVAHDEMESTQKRALYLKDRVSGTARRLSASTHVLNGPRIYSKRWVYWYYGMYATMSGDGSRILYSDFIDNAGPKDLGSSLYLNEPQQNREVDLTVLPHGQHIRVEAHSWQPSLSADGSLVAYSSSADLLGFPTPPFLPYPRTFLLDIKRHTLRETSVDANGQSETFPETWGLKGATSKIAASGNRVLISSDFHSDMFASDVSTYEVLTGVTKSLGSLGGPPGDISADGNFLSYNSSNGDLIVRKIDAPPGESLIRNFSIYANSLRMSGDGSKIAFATDSDPATHSHFGAYAAFVADVLSGVAERLTQGDKDDLGEEFFGTYSPVSRTQIGLSSNGKWLAYPSASTNLVTDDTNDLDDLFLQDLETKEIRRVQGRTEPNGPSYEPNLSADGKFLVFTSHASNLVDGDTNELADVFVYNRITGDIAMVSKTHNGGLGDGISSEPALSDDGQYIAFSSEASNMIAEGTRRGIRQVYRVRNPLQPSQEGVRARRGIFTPIAVPSTRVTTEPDAGLRTVRLQQGTTTPVGPDRYSASQRPARRSKPEKP